MVRQVKISGWLAPPLGGAGLASTMVCLLLLAPGCAPLGEEAVKPEVEVAKQIPEVTAEEAAPTVVKEAAEPEAELEEQIPKAPPAAVATLALKFTPQDSTTYRLISEAQQSVKWTGAVPDDPQFKGGLKLDRLEMTFSQQIQSIDDKGNAIAKITVEGLKYSSETEDKSILDFDSSKPKDPNHPLAKLTGQSYTIKIAPTGEVMGVIDVKEAQAAVRKGSSAPRTALRLLMPDVIKERHGTLVLPEADKNQLQTGDNWSSIKTFSFGLMGSNSYEKIYTLKEIKDIDNRQVAIVEMNTIPTSETAEQLDKEQVAFDFSEVFDSTGTYTGQLKFDLTVGKVEKYLEKLQLEWTTVLPSAEAEDKGPAVLIMGAIRLYDLEKIN